VGGEARKAATSIGGVALGFLRIQLDCSFQPHWRDTVKKKKLQNMERLWQKMQARFGDQDPLVIAFKQELTVLQESGRKELLAHNFGRRQADAVDAKVIVH
jgi:hypothetical protein